MLLTNIDLSHVPCKFYRQGTCQAGNSCPFSHQIDTTSETQICKYFQKGNCKFGVKCALAHVYNDNKKNINNTNNNNNNNNNNNTNSNTNTTQKITNNKEYQFNPQNSQTFIPSIDEYSNNNNINTNNYSYHMNETTLPNSSSSSSNQIPLLSSTLTSISYNSVPNNTFMWNADNNANTNNNINQLNNNDFIINSNSSKNLNSSPLFQNQPLRSFSFSNTSPINNSNQIYRPNINSQYSNTNQYPNTYQCSPIDLMMMSPSSLSVPTSMNQAPQYSSFVNNTNAIIDSDDDNNNNSAGNDNEDIDYIPSTLQDLLTPQELIRRKSRSSFGSNPNSSGFSKGQYCIVEEETAFFME